MHDVVIAIDPGKGGGIAIRQPGVDASIWKMPETIYDVMQFFYSTDLLNSVCVLEQLHAGSVSYGRMKSSKTIWSQAENYTAIKCALYAAGIKCIEVTPAKWMQKLPGTRPKDYNDRKRWLKEHAQRLYPQEKVTLWNADALCLLHVSGEFI